MVRAGCLVMGGSSRRWAAGPLILMDDRGDAAAVWTGRADHRRRPSHVGPPAAHTPRHPAAPGGGGGVPVAPAVPHTPQDPVAPAATLQLVVAPLR